VDFKRYLKVKTQKVNEALEKLLPPADRHPARLHAAMRYSLFAGGKRVRPILALASAEAAGGSEEDAMPAACALECIHTYSLIHDDLPAMDDDDLRRGMKTCHRAFDEPTAILAGDALLTLAFEALSDPAHAGAEPARIVRVVRELAHGAGSAGMVGGQMIDVESEGKPLTLPELQYMHLHKTGALIAASVRSGAILGGADDETLASLTSYAKAIGLAFQIADDVLDVEGETAEIGKQAGADEKRGKVTYPSLMGVSESKARARELVDTALGAISGLGPSSEPLREMAAYIVERKN
jgi:geranylgeranyl diphosphate synthase type II